MKKELRLTQTVRARLDHVMSFVEVTDTETGGVDIDAIAKKLEALKSAEGEQVDACRDRDYQRIRAALPEELRNLLRRYVDAVDGKQYLYAEAGYLIGVEVERQLRERAR